MAEKLHKLSARWRLVVPTPQREVFAVMEQMCGTPPYRFEILGPACARIVEFERNSLVGHWRRLALVGGDGRQKTGPDGEPQWRTRVRWVTCTATEVGAGSEVVVEASSGRGAVPRALQLVQLLDRGARDRRTVYRERNIPHGPTTLVASWAGTPYRLYTEPRYDAPRGEPVYTAGRITAVGMHGVFVRVRLASGIEGYVELDQLVPAPTEATRDAQARTASLA